MKILTLHRPPNTKYQIPNTSQSADLSLSEEFYEYFNVHKKENKIESPENKPEGQE